MTVRSTMRIPASKAKQHQEIVGATGGRYLRNPEHLSGGDLLVDIEHGDYEEFSERWYRLESDIVEKPRAGRMRRLWRWVIGRVKQS